MANAKSPLPVVPLSPAALTPHPRNYRAHPDDQLAHIVQSIQDHGFYRNVVVARGDVILAGHGVVKAALKMGLDHVPVIRLDLDPADPRALKVLAGDNEIGKLAEVDDRALTEMLREISQLDVDGLLGTGFNDDQLAALVMTTRPASEIKDIDEASAWVGMPEYEAGGTPIKLVIGFNTMAERARYVAETGLRVDMANPSGPTWSTRWPWTERENRASIAFRSDGQAIKS